jgi:hypothetical protein
MEAAAEGRASAERGCARPICARGSGGGRSRGGRKPIIRGAVCPRPRYDACDASRRRIAPIAPIVLVRFRKTACFRGDGLPQVGRRQRRRRREMSRTECPGGIRLRGGRNNAKPQRQKEHCSPASSDKACGEALHRRIHSSGSAPWQLKIPCRAGSLLSGPRALPRRACNAPIADIDRQCRSHPKQPPAL